MVQRLKMGNESAVTYIEAAQCDVSNYEQFKGTKKPTYFGSMEQNVFLVKLSENNRVKISTIFHQLQLNCNWNTSQSMDGFG